MSLPYTSLFSTTLILSTSYIFFSTHWLLMWAALEANLISLLPLIVLTSQNQENESSIKYFLAQALGSSLLISTSMILFNPPILNLHHTLILKLLFFLSLMLKIGAAPIHFWFPSVMAGLSWPLVILTSTWQKIAPLALMSSLNLMTFFLPLMLLGGLNAMVGGLGGLNQSQLRPLLAYSSIGHIGWMVASITISTAMLMLYFMFYLLTITPLMIILWKTCLFSTKFSSTKLNKSTLFIMMLLILSLGGLPPLLGFFPKWSLLLYISPNTPWLLLIPLITGSLMNIFFYISIFVPTFYATSYPSKKHFLNTMNPITLFSMTAWFLPPLLFMALYALTIFN